MTCPQCGRPHDAGSKFCRGCGTRFETVADAASTCGACQAPLKPGARFCKQCGAASAVAAPDPLPEAPLVEAVPSALPAEPPVPDRKPEIVAAGTGSSRGVVIAASVVLAVVAVGGLVTWGFLRKGDAPAGVAIPIVAEAASTPSANPGPGPVVAAPGTVAQAPIVEAAPVTTPPVVAAVVTAPRAETPSAPVETSPHTLPVPAEKPARAKRFAAPVDAPAPMQDVAMNLVRKGESAFSRQDYSTAIANARAALDVNPGLARARQLLDEAQHAQQQAMNSISIQ